jgi:hypothetical protein
MEKKPESLSQEAEAKESPKISFEGEEHFSEIHNDHEDLSHFSKEDLLKYLQNFRLTGNISQDNALLREVKFHFDHLLENERDQALQKFIETGGKEEDFEFRKDSFVQKFEKNFDNLKTTVSENYNRLEKEKEKNLQIKNELLDKLRQLTSAEETTTSINTLKEIQDQWRKTGPVPLSHSQNLWASYNALVEMFYNNRSIYFELKELDRKKNLELKKELVEKAEKLAENNNIIQAIRELRNLHEEFRHIGPVPKEDQEELWNKFKAASDKIYEKRKEHFAVQKKQLEENYEKKNELIKKIEELSAFKTDRIDEWKEKTAEVLSLQTEWKKTGRVHKDKAKESSKKFWSACKTFFNNKNAFFRELESHKEENLKLKTELCEKAEALKESDDFKNTANALKELQKKWEEIGPVPLKVKDEIYKRFKTACDQFFSRKREQHAETEKEFVQNLQKKLSIIEQIEQLAGKTDKDPHELKVLQDEWKHTGFVPKNELKNLNEKYNQAIEKYIAGLESLNEKDTLLLIKSFTEKRVKSTGRLRI